MDRNNYILRAFRKILKEDLEEKAESMMNKLNYDKETKLYRDNEFDYVQEGKNEMCEVCGGEMKEGEACEQCGAKGEVMELGGMDDGHPRFGKMKFKSPMSIEDIENLLRGDEDEDDEDYKPRKRNKRDDDEEFDFELDESWYSHDEYERMRNFGSEDELRAYQDKLVSGGEKKKSKKEDDEDEITEKLHGKQHRLDKNKNGRIDKGDFKMLRKQQDEDQLYEVEFENEVEEGDKFSGELANARKEGKKTFKVGGKIYPVKESYLTETWKGKNKVTESILFTETDLIDLIEKLVILEKNSFQMKEPKGFKEYEKVHKADQKENDKYLKSLAKKMTDYLKPVSDEGSKYEMKKTKKFPTENGGMKKGIRKKYTPSDAVDDYNDAFSYPGQTNLRFDEIKPNKKNIKKYLKGHRTTGNAQIDEDGNALGNVVPSKVGDKFFKNFEENLYGQEQAEASYKRQSQPVDVAGEDTEEGSLKSKRPKGGKGKSAQSVLNKLSESIEPKKIEKLNEEYNRIQQLMGYNRKTQ